MEKFEKMFVSPETDKNEENTEEKNEKKYQYTSKDGTVNFYESREDLIKAREEERENS